MSIRFRTLASSSAGNCIELSTGGATLLIECGFRSQRACNQALDQIRGEVAVVVSHAHGDHCSYAGVKALAKRGVPIRAHGRVLEQIHHRIPSHGWSTRPRYEAFGDGPFTMLDFVIKPIAVEHAPGYPNFAFSIECRLPDRVRRVIVGTDLWNPSDIKDALVDADLIYIESNHDPELLRLHPNPSSRYHLSNPKTASLLAWLLSLRRRGPQAIILGHLSDQRNRDHLALNSVRNAVARHGLTLDAKLSAAPLYDPSDYVHID